MGENNIEKVISDFMEKLETSAPLKGKKAKKKPVEKSSFITNEGETLVEAKKGSPQPEVAKALEKTKAEMAKDKSPLGYYQALSKNWKTALEKDIHKKVLEGKSKKAIEDEISAGFLIEITADWQDWVINEVAKAAGKLVLPPGGSDVTEEVVTGAKDTSDEAIIAYIKTLPTGGWTTPAIAEMVLTHFPLLHPSNNLTKLIYKALGITADVTPMAKVAEDAKGFLAEAVKESEKKKAWLESLESPVKSDGEPVYVGGEDYSEFLTELAKVASVLKDAVITPVPDQPIVLTLKPEGGYLCEVPYYESIHLAAKVGEDIAKLMGGYGGGEPKVNKLEISFDLDTLSLLKGILEVCSKESIPKKKEKK